jgi:hypothetical protein
MNVALVPRTTRLIDLAVGKRLDAPSSCVDGTGKALARPWIRADVEGGDRVLRSQVRADAFAGVEGHA